MRSDANASIWRRLIFMVGVRQPFSMDHGSGATTSSPARRMFYLATLGRARSMQLEGTIGNFAPGTEADFIVLDPPATPLLARRTERTDSLEELLVAIAMLVDDRTVAATYAAGKAVHQRQD
jgi:guanine deaminase